jgi:hypothetical protein
VAIIVGWKRFWRLKIKSFCKLLDRNLNGNLGRRETLIDEMEAKVDLKTECGIIEGLGFD